MKKLAHNQQLLSYTGKFTHQELCNAIQGNNHMMGMDSG